MTSSPVIAIQILLINLKSIKQHIQSVKMCKIKKTDWNKLHTIKHIEPNKPEQYHLNSAVW